MHLLRRLFLPVAVGLLIAAALVVPVPFYLEAPGSPLGLAGRVTVATPDSTPIEGDYLLTTVVVRRASLTGLVTSVFDEAVAIVPSGQLIPPGIDEQEYFRRQQRVFDTTAQLAAAVALEAAGFPVDPAGLSGDGAVIVRVLPDTPAEGALAPGDVVIAAGGSPIRTAEELREAVLRNGGEPLRLTFERDGDERVVELVPRPVADVPEPVLGVQVETRNPRIDLPVPVQVDTGEIGGPSAGLLIALTVYDKVVEEDLSAGRRIAGTGGITTAGEIRPIGGIAQKVLSATRADLDVFLAPASQLEAACGGLPRGEDLVVLGVADFQQAVAALRGDPSVPGCSPEG